MLYVAKNITVVKRRHRLAQSCFTRSVLLLVCLLAGPSLSSSRVYPTEDRYRKISTREIHRELKPGSSIVGEIPGQASHAFKITLESNQYLRLAVQKADSNISLTVFGPSGEKLVECTDHEYRPLEASIVARSPGSYELIVRSLEQEPAARRYELMLEPLLKLQPSDLEDHRALKASGEADQLLATWNEASLHKAIEKFMEASSAWRAIRPDRAVDALRGAADIHFVLGAYSEAISLNRQALKESENIGPRLREIEALIAIGRIYSLLGENHTARRYLAKVLAYSNQNDHVNGPTQEKRLAAEAHNCMGEIYYTEGNSIKALGYFKRALELWTEIGYRRGQAQAKLNLGYSFSSSGDREQALLSFTQAMEIYRAIDDQRGAALSLTAIGSVHSLDGNEQASLESHMQAMETFRRIGDRRGQGVTLNAVGQAYEDLGDQQAALDNYVRAKQLFETTGSVATVSEYKIATVYRSLGDIEKALSHYHQCVALSRAARKRRIEAYALKDIAEIYHSQGRKQQTFRQYKEILDVYRNLGDFRGQAITLKSIGDLFFSYGEKQRAFVSYKRALRLIRVAGDRAREISILYEISRTARDANLLEDALSHIEQAIKLIETLRIYVASPDLRSSYFASVHQNYELYIQILMQLDRQQPGHGHAAAALQASESARSRVLIEVLAEAGADLRQGVATKQIEQQRELQQSLAAKERYQMQLASSRETQEEAALVAREIRELTMRDQILEAQIRQQNPRYAALAQPQPLSVEQIQAELDDADTLLLEYALGEDKSYLWAVTKDSLTSYELPSRAIIEAVAREVYDLLTSREHVEQKTNYETQISRSDAAYTEKALALSRMLLEPVASQLGRKRLLVISDGILQYIPFEALPAPHAELTRSVDSVQSIANEQPLLISNHEVVNLPSISVLAAVRRQTATAASRQKIVTILADPVFETDDPRVRSLNGQQADRNADSPREIVGALRDFEGFGNGNNIPRLRYTLDEANAILKLVASNQGRAATGFDADLSSVLNSQIEHYQIVHFATHSLINSSQPQLSGILLTMVDRRGVPQNGFLQLRDIYNLNLSAKLVVLSACSTGLGKDVKGEGLIGLTRGFMHAGSRSVVASLWKVDDRATAELMTRFYAAMLKDNLPPAAALRVAKESMRREKRWRAPYYWAAFVLQGEYRERVNIEGGRAQFPYMIVGLLVVMICLPYVVYAMKTRRKLTSTIERPL
jgi:CHAT domain-containing protein/tetratricopeptide (TPR) repeat protein